MELACTRRTRVGAVNDVISFSGADCSSSAVAASCNAASVCSRSVDIPDYQSRETSA
jgi:hypothetical protein